MIQFIIKLIFSCGEEQILDFRGWYPIFTLAHKRLEFIVKIWRFNKMNVKKKEPMLKMKSSCFQTIFSKTSFGYRGRGGLFNTKD
jgi:hypothetical protein